MKLPLYLILCIVCSTELLDNLEIAWSMVMLSLWNSSNSKDDCLKFSILMVMQLMFTVNS